ncbi:hypothetical protein ABPG77_005934 [Micractinium sp. CCAP 211/92]
MPLIVVAGLPSSGKSSVAAALAEACRALGQDVQVVDEDSLHFKRNESYKDAAAEKQARGALMSAAERCLSRKRTVIFDSHNNIKGYRYQLWCHARSAGTRYCMVHVDTPVESCREWNAARPAEGAYSQEIFEDLACRFECPDSRNRWDSPLFMVRPLLGQVQLQEQVAAVAAAVADRPPAARGAAAGAADHAGAGEAGVAANGGSSAATAAAVGGEAAGILPPIEQILDEPALVLEAKELVPTITTDTSHTKLAATNLQHEIDRAVQRVVEAVAAAQSVAGSGAPGVVTFEATGGSSGALPPLDVYRPMFLPELRRHKRGFMKLATSQTFSRLQDAAAAQRLFIGYLRDQLAQQ